VTKPKASRPDPDVGHDPKLVLLIAECEAARLRLESAIRQGASHRVIAELAELRVTALEALAEHQGLVPSSPHAFVPPASDRSRRKTRNPAA